MPREAVAAPARTATCGVQRRGHSGADLEGMTGMTVKSRPMKAGGDLVLGGVDLPPAPAMPPQKPWRYDGFYDAYVPDWDGGPMRWEPAPHPDLYLHAAYVDEYDDPAVIAFINRHGVPSVDPLSSGELHPAHSDRQVPPLLGLPVIDEDLGNDVRPQPRSRPGAIRGAAFFASRPAVRAAFKTIRFLVETWGYLGEEGPAPSWRPAGTEGNDGRLAFSFARVFDSCLAPVSPRAFVNTYPQRVPDWLIDAPLVLSVLALQLAHHIARGTDWSHCANERCGRRFEYQTHRRESADMRRRAGGRYCSDRCAERVRQRRAKAKAKADRQAEDPDGQAG